MSEDGKKPKRRLGISQRTSLFAVTIALLSIAFFAVAIIAHEKSMLRTDLVNRARLLAASVDHTTATYIVTEDYTPVIDQCSLMVDRNPEVVYAVVTRYSDGFSLIHLGAGKWSQETLGGAKWQPPGVFESRSSFEHAEFVDVDVLHYSYPFRFSGVDWGWIHVGMDLKDYRANLAETYRIIALLAGGSLLIGVVFAMRFARGLTRPIHQLRQWAEWVSQGNFSGRVEISSGDELGDLAESMNRMTADLFEGMNRKAELREKDVLLKEIHHRVKNNMQILSSLLRMQGRSSEVPGMIDVLRDSESRIRSMGLIHEKLYQSESISDIEFGGYVGALAKELQRMYSATAGRVRIDVDVAKDIAFGLDTALPCGLIVNELVSNSLKYAFPDNREGRITLSMHRLDEGGFEMTVADDGVGLVAHGDGPAGVREGSLGTRLVEMLADQLDGEAERYEPDGGGVATRISIRESEYETRL